MTGLVVELCGLPGSGKTTVAGHMRTALQRAGFPGHIVDQPISASAPPVTRLLRRTAASARASVARPRWALGVGADVAAVRQPARRDTASVLAQWLAVCDLTSRAHRRPGIHLLEEGLVQTMWTLMLRSEDPPPPRLWASLPTTSRSDLVVLVDVPVPVVQERLVRRASRHSRSQQLPPDLLRAELERGDRLLAALVATARPPVLRVRGSHETEAADVAAEATRLVLAQLDGC